MHSPSTRSVRIAGVLILVWIGAYWSRSPGGGAVPLDPGLLARPDTGPPAEAPEAILPHERAAEIPVPVRPDPIAAAEPPASPPAEATPAREHVVRDGDTLGAIALAEYGSIVYAELIFEANRDRLRSPHDLRLGMKLRLPARPEP